MVSGLLMLITGCVAPRLQCELSFFPWCRVSLMLLAFEVGVLFHCLKNVENWGCLLQCYLTWVVSHLSCFSPHIFSLCFAFQFFGIHVI